MPELYRLHLGHVNAAYYQQRFQRFESAGKASPSWNQGAAFFTLAWLLLRKLWLPAGIYAAALWSLVALWWWGLHGRVPLAIEGAACLLALLLLCVVPGFMANGLYYHHVRSQALQTLRHASSLGQARRQLADQAITQQRVYRVVAIQALVALAITAAAGWLTLGGGPVNPTAPTPARAVSGPPDLLIPSAPHLPPLALQPIPPDLVVPATEAAVAATPTQNPAGLPPVKVTPPVTPNAEASVLLPAPSSKTAEPKQQQLQPPSPAAAKTRIEPTGKYYLNAGVFAYTANVDAAVAKLKMANLQTVRQTVSSKQGELTRLQIGPFDTRKQAEKAAAQAQKLRIPTTLALPPKP